MPRTRLTVLIIGLMLTALLSGCSKTPPELSKEEQVQQRAQAYLDALMAQDLAAALSYTSPAFRQRVTEPNAYINYIQGVGMWRAAEVESVECRERSCDVEVAIRYMNPMLGTELQSAIRHQWIQTADDWWIFHAPRN